MRVLLVSNQFFPVTGGIENWLRDYAPALRSRGHDVAVLTGRHRSAREQIDAYEGIPVFRSDLERSRANRDARGVHRSQRWIESIEREWTPDVVHAHDVGPNLWAHVRIPDRAPTLTTIHASLPALLDPASVPVALRLLDACEWVSCVSRVALEEVRALAPPIADRSSYVPNGVVVPTDPPVAPPLEPRVLCLGRLVAQKGFDVAVSAMPELIDRVPGATLDIAGDGCERPNLERLVDDLGLRAAVRFHGVVRHSDVGTWLDATRVLAMPSRFEGLPIVWLEAALRGRPAVATATHGLGEVIAHGRTGWLVPPDDASALASGLATVLERPGLAGALGMAARDQVIQGYSMTACLDAYSDLYDRIAVRPDRSTTR